MPYRSPCTAPSRPFPASHSHHRALYWHVRALPHLPCASYLLFRASHRPFCTLHSHHRALYWHVRALPHLPCASYLLFRASHRPFCTLHSHHRALYWHIYALHWHAHPFRISPYPYKKPRSHTFTQCVPTKQEQQSIPLKLAPSSSNPQSIRSHSQGISPAFHGSKQNTHGIKRISQSTQ